MSLGKYPEISLREARSKRDEIKNKIKDGLNPIVRKEDVLFKKIVSEYFKKREDLSLEYTKDCLAKLEKNIYPFFDSIKDITAMEMLRVLQKMDNRGANVSAKKTFSLVDRIFKFAVMHNYTNRNIMSDLDKSLAFRTVITKNFAHTTDIKELKTILLGIDEYFGDYNTKMALKILPYVFVRPSNLRGMKWEDINFEKKYG